MTIKTKRINTNGIWEKAEDLFNISLQDNGTYAIQVLGIAYLSYSSTIPNKDCFTIDFSQPFTYEKKANEDLYIKTDGRGVTITIAE